MTKGYFRGYLALLAALILFSLSPLAALGGLVVAVVLVMPAGVLLGAFGLLEKGNGFDGQLAVLFGGLAGCLALLALWLAYRAAAHHERGKSDLARTCAALAATALGVPVVIYFCYSALGI